MKVAVVSARGPAGDAGGAERLYEGLVAAFDRAGHDADHVPVLVDEGRFETIEEAYLRCWDLDLARYDLVVSTKAPTFLVRHPRHACWLVHTIRVFYDMFDTAFPQPTAQLRAQRELVHRLDTLALARVSRRFAIGHEVSARLQRYNGLDARVLHPPLAFDAFHEGPSGDYLFMPGRLHPWKRVSLAIEAMRHVATPVRLVVAGSGEQEAELRDMASGLPVEFAGRVDDAQLVRLYAGSLGVVFLPLREDYGYVTVEAFRSGKPVVTCADSGEAAFIVEDGRSGFVVEPSPQAVAHAMDRLWQDRATARALGAAGHRFVGALRWERVVAELAAD